MSFWAATLHEKPTTIGEDECDIVITQACIQNSGALSAGTVVSLLAMSEGSSWVTLARFRTTESESTPLRIVIAAGSELTLKVTGKGAVDIAGYQILPEDDEVESEGVSMDSESADEEEVSPPPGKRKLEAHPEATASKAAKADASSQPNQAAKQVKPAASSPTAQQPKTPPAKAGASAEVGGADFVASPKFTGSRAGFVFKKGAKGVGYYRDTPPSPAKGVAAAAAQPKKQSADEWAKETLAQREWKAGPGGLRYRDLAAGAAGGATPRKGQRVTVHYTGRLAKGGKQFDSSVGRKPFVFTYGRGEVIKGWDLGLDGMRVGGRRELEIPAQLGYGAKGAKPDIPGNATLLFEIQLLKC